METKNLAHDAYAPDRRCLGGYGPPPKAAAPAQSEPPPATQAFPVPEAGLKAYAAA